MLMSWLGEKEGRRQDDVMAGPCSVSGTNHVMSRCDGQAPWLAARQRRLGGRDRQGMYAGSLLADLMATDKKENKKCKEDALALILRLREDGCYHHR